MSVRSEVGREVTGAGYAGLSRPFLDSQYACNGSFRDVVASYPSGRHSQLRGSAAHKIVKKSDLGSSDPLAGFTLAPPYPEAQDSAILRLLNHLPLT